MATLHLLTAGPEARARLETLLADITPNDCILLLDDGVLWAAHRHWETGCPASVYVLADQARARGLVPHPLVQPIDYESWVALACRCENSLTW